MSQPLHGVPDLPMQEAPIAEPVIERIAYLGFCGPIDSGAVGRICAAMNTAVNQGYTGIYLNMSSPGGYVGDGIYLYNHIRSLPIECTIHNTGSVSSVATTIFVAGQKRYCTPNAIFMIHPVTMNPNGPMQAAALNAWLQAALHDEERTEAILREHTSIPDDVYERRLSEDIYLPAAKAQEFGLVHDIRPFTLPPGNQIFHV